MGRMRKAAVAAALWATAMIVGCTGGARPEPPQPPQPDAAGLTPYAIAFWDEKTGLITGQSGCPVKCGDYIIARTEDGGSTWTEVYRAPERIGGLAAVASGAWASTDRGLLRSSDGGRTWQGGAAGYAEPTFAGGTTGWALAATGENRWNEEGALFTTGDGGKTWSRLNSPCAGTPLGAAGAIHLASETEGWVGCMGQPGAGQQMKALYRTGDGGRTWTMAADLGGGGYLRGLFFRPGGKGWVWLSRGGLRATADGGKTWQWLKGVQPEAREAWDLWMVSDQVGFMLLRDNEVRQFQLVRTADGGASVTVVRQWPIDPPR